MTLALKALENHHHRMSEYNGFLALLKSGLKEKNTNAIRNVRVGDPSIHETWSLSQYEFDIYVSKESGTIPVETVTNTEEKFELIQWVLTPNLQDFRVLLRPKDSDTSREFKYINSQETEQCWGLIQELQCNFANPLVAVLFGISGQSK